MKLIPYVNFAGNCEEALNTYKKILGGKIEIVSRYDNPAMKTPEEYKNKVLHAWFEFDGIYIYASDVFPGRPMPVTGNVALSLEADSVEKGKEIFNALAEGGRVNHPFEKQFWGGWHGNLIDRFGVFWMINGPDN